MMGKVLQIMIVACALSESAEADALLPNGPYFIYNNKPVVVTSMETVVLSDNLGDQIEIALPKLLEKRITYVRLWHILPWDNQSQWPWMKVGDTFDFNQWNPLYWNRLTSTVRQLTEAGITTEIMFFDSSSMKKTNYDRNPWSHLSPARSEENNGYPSFYENLGLRNKQREFVEKMIQETARFNVIYEIENEHLGTFAVDVPGNFISDMAATARAVLHNMGINRGISFSPLSEADKNNKNMVHINKARASFYKDPNIGIINLHMGTDEKGRELEMLMELRKDIRMLQEDPVTAQKPIILDEFGNGFGELFEDTGKTKAGRAIEEDILYLRQQAWVALVSGAHFHIEDATEDAQPLKVVHGAQSFLKETGFEFYNAKPEGHRSHVDHNDMCLSHAGGIEKFCYFPIGGAGCRQITFGPRRYYYFWWEPSTHTFYEGETIGEGITGNYNVIPPDDNKNRDWVLYIVEKETYFQRNSPALKNAQLAYIPKCHQ